MRHHLEDIAGTELSADGRKVGLLLLTSTAQPFSLEIDTTRLDEVVCQLLALALRAGVALGVNPQPGAGDELLCVPIPTHGVATSIGPEGTTAIIVRVGCIDLALQIDNMHTLQLGHELIALSAAAPAGPLRMQ